MSALLSVIVRAYEAALAKADPRWVLGLSLAALGVYLLTTTECVVDWREGSPVMFYNQDAPAEMRREEEIR